jgi:hypothetical protein
MELLDDLYHQVAIECEKIVHWNKLLKERTKSDRHAYYVWDPYDSEGIVS